MNKLTKAQEKRFDEKFHTKGITYFVGQEVVLETSDLKQHLADELARQKKEIIEKVIKLIRSGEFVNGSFADGCDCIKCNKYEKVVRKELSKQLKK